MAPPSNGSSTSRLTNSMLLETTSSRSGSMGLRTTTLHKWANLNIAESSTFMHRPTRIRPTAALLAGDTLPDVLVTETLLGYFFLLGKNRNDQATKNFLPCLKDHLLGHLSGLDYDGDETSFMLRVNYTTYDLRRAQDSLNPRTHADIMVLARDQEDSHPYWYARVIGVFHVNTRYMRPGAHPSIKRVDFLWVRWFARDITAPTVGPAKRLAMFVGVQLIPAFDINVQLLLLGLSIARQAADKDEDWDWYCINMFVDQICSCAFAEEVSGTKTTRRETSCLLDDRMTWITAFKGDEDMDEHEDGDEVGDSEEEADDSEETDSMDDKGRG
ncbi:hypothetical protein DFJ58DRAFT_738932 [Suillus subalutaceus]|uniref:uncharacterized protein n=1 Tax=Suillus subalutaceus TaxID=48586 RepID=UPI001B85F496|nr:uncharacterized protein DFJ58DRAFT_738932 [Suillus subalutaceus]KAG1823079.1 hypothetical protein DFJ58DRAFT_738932 [Suillus subalutaceus]